jgi:hypothetical protein
MIIIAIVVTIVLIAVCLLLFVLRHMYLQASARCTRGRYSFLIKNFWKAAGLHIVLAGSQLAHGIIQTTIRSSQKIGAIYSMTLSLTNYCMGQIPGFGMTYGIMMISSRLFYRCGIPNITRLILIRFRLDDPYIRSRR